MIVKAGSPFSFNYTAYDQDDSLFVLARIWDVTGTPVLVDSIEMENTEFGNYVAVFDPDADKTYSIVMVVFTDNTYTVPDDTRSPGSLTVQSIMFESGSDLSAILEQLLIITSLLNTCSITGTVTSDAISAEVSCP